MMVRGVWLALILLLATAGCDRRRGAEPVLVEIPAGFSGDFVLRMGVKNAQPLAKQGQQYLITVPKDGNVATSSLLMHPQVTFKNSSDGSVWGYSESMFTTGDGIPVGGKIEFFVGTKKDFEAAEGKKKHSSEFTSPQRREAEL
jgi:hypothetical protein